ncbi:hypothetical protein [Desulfocurvus sp. DL9XJH121]
MPHKTSSISASSAFWGIALTVLFVLAVDQACGLVMDSIYPRSTASPVGRIVNADPENLVLGSSTARYAVNPETFLPGTRNGAENGQSLFYCAAVLRALPQDTRLKRVFLGVDPLDLTNGLKTPTLKHLWAVYPRIRKDAHLRQRLGTLRRIRAVEYLSGLFPHHNGLFNMIRQYLFPKPPEDSLYSWYPGQHHELTPAKAPEGPPHALDPDAMQALRDIAEDAQRLGVELVPFSSPVYGQVREHLDVNRLLYAGLREALAPARPTDLTDHDDPRLEAFAMTKTYFWDGPHMNDVGGREYARLLADMYRQRTSREASHAGQ